jgi:hypothetical protein
MMWVAVSNNAGHSFWCDKSSAAVGAVGVMQN